MNKVSILLTESNGNLSSAREMIISAIKTAEEYVFPKLKIDWDIDLLVTNRLRDIVIPEDGVGGYTRTADFIEFAINEEKATENLISEMIAHEARVLQLIWKLSLSKTEKKKQSLLKLSLSDLITKIKRSSKSFAIS